MKSSSSMGERQLKASSGSLLPPPSACNGTQYYISAAGSDSNDGTSSSAPWQTIAKVNSPGFKFGSNTCINFRGGGASTTGVVQNNDVGGFTRRRFILS